MIVQNAGDIRNQIGKTLNDISLNVEQQDVPGLTWHVRYLKAKIGPYMTDKQTTNWKALNPPETAGWTEFFEASMEQIEMLLRIAKMHNIYGWRSVPVGEDDGEEYALSDGGPGLEA